MIKATIQRRLEAYVKKYFKRHPEVKLVIVAGSVGKTSTKMAIATVLSQRFRVRTHEGNHNSELSAPLAMLGVEFPSNLRHPLHWYRAFAAARRRIAQPTDVDVIVQEVGTDGIGQVPHFGTYATPDLAVITAVSEEHMEFFGTLDAVAAEELAAANFSKAALINRDDIDGRFAADITNANISTYGTTGVAEYRFEEADFSLEKGYTGSIISPGLAPISVHMNVLGEAATRAAAAAAAVGLKLGMTREDIAQGLESIRPVAGRMNPLKGVKQSLIIDDTYNSSPRAVAAALATLYQLPAPQKIAVLGSMNELGETSAGAHQYVGSLCDNSQLAWVITVGDEAERYMADEARKKGCQVRSFKTALEAGAFVHQVMEEHAVVLFKGSQGGVYLEEAIKIVLHDTADEAKLVRQSASWIEIKNQFFSTFTHIPSID